MTTDIPAPSPPPTWSRPGWAHYASSTVSLMQRRSRKCSTGPDARAAHGAPAVGAGQPHRGDLGAAAGLPHAARRGQRQHRLLVYVARHDGRSTGAGDPAPGAGAHQRHLEPLGGGFGHHRARPGPGGKYLVLPPATPARSPCSRSSPAHLPARAGGQPTADELRQRLGEGLHHYRSRRRHCPRTRWVSSPALVSRRASSLPPMRA